MNHYIVIYKVYLDDENRDMFTLEEEYITAKSRLDAVKEFKKSLKNIHPELQMGKDKSIEVIQINEM